MRYLLDTDACVQHLRGRGGITESLRRLPEGEVTLSALTAFELLSGAYKSRHPAKSLAAVAELLERLGCLPFDQECADRAAHTRAALERAGQGIGPVNLLIAGVALRYGLTLVTHNTREFHRVMGLSVEDWQVH